jgi:hypothetical protein
LVQKAGEEGKRRREELKAWRGRQLPDLGWVEIMRRVSGDSMTGWPGTIIVRRSLKKSRLNRYNSCEETKWKDDLF